MTELWRWAPHWNDPIQEDLQWLTEVVESEAGLETRTRLRKHPRRSMSFTALVQDFEARDLERLLFSTQVDEWLMPVWWDAARPATGGATFWQNNDTQIGQFRDWQVGGQVAAHNGSDWATFEISFVATNGILVTTTIPEEFRADKSVIYPLFPVAITPTITRDDVTPTIQQVQVTADFIDYESPDPTDLPTQYLGGDVLEQMPDRTEPIVVQVARQIEIVDGGIGVRSWVDDPSSPRVDRERQYVITDREEIWTLRRWLQKIGGRDGFFWCPSDQRDLGVVAIGVSGIGVDAGGGEIFDVDHRSHLYAKLRDGDTYLAEIVDYDDDPAFFEGVDLNPLFPSPFSVGLAGEPPEAIKRLAWLEPVRLIGDTISIEWHSHRAVVLSLATRALREAVGSAPLPPIEM